MDSLAGNGSRRFWFWFFYFIIMSPTIVNYRLERRGSQVILPILTVGGPSTSNVGWVFWDLKISGVYVHNMILQ